MSGRYGTQFKDMGGKRGSGRIGSVVLAAGAIVGVGGLFAYAGIGLRRAQERPPDRAAQAPVAVPKPAQAITVAPAADSPVLPPNPMLLMGATDAVPVLLYHDVSTKKRVWTDISPTEFAEQMKELAAAGARPVSIQDFYDHFNVGKPLPDHPILLTFDDGTVGQFENALPVLEKYHFPAAFFVPTDLVGLHEEIDRADWETIRKAAQDGLITFGSHTVANPQNLTLVSDEVLTAELEESRKALEDHLGVPVRFLAYPNGHADARAAKAALAAGYNAALTMDRGWAGSPAQAYFLPRFAPQRLPEILAVWKAKGAMEPPPPRFLEIKEPPLTQGTFKDGRYAVQWVAGGDLGTQALHSRSTVGQMAEQAHVEAALNGAFFSEIRLRTLGSAMMGPTLCRADQKYSPATLDEDARLEGRPLVLIGPNKCLVLPYAEHLGHSQDVLQALMPDVTDAFLAGGWIVHHGKALPPATLLAWSSHDANDARHRVFAGVDKEHRFLLGGTQDGIGTAQLSKILEKMKLEEAWLMDSGYSSSLVWRNRILISGHNDRATPSRPVPHALFLYGEPASDAPLPPADALPASGPGAATTAEAFAADMGRHHRKKKARTRRHRRARAASPAAASPTPAPDAAPAEIPAVSPGL